MTSAVLFQVFLVLHILGISTAIGITLANMAFYRRFWNLYASNPEQGLPMFRLASTFQILGMAGLFLAILSGISMLLIAHGAFASFLWFRIKMSLVLLLFVNGFTLGRSNSLKINRFLKGKPMEGKRPLTLKSLKRNLNLFQFTQLFLFLIIIILVIFQFR